MLSQNVGIIGVGLMGHGIALNVQKAGAQLHFLDHPGNQPTEDLRARGAVACKTAEDLAKACDMIILCVTGAPQVEEILSETGALLSALRPGALIIDCSTSLPGVSRKVDGLVRQAGGRYIDAPMTRTPKEAAEGRLNLIVGGDADEVAAARPVLETFAENIHLAGPVGAGHAMKLLHNFVSLGFSAVLAEATAAARSAGVADPVFQEILAQGGGAGVVLDRMTPFILENNCGAFLFSIANSNKDIGYYRQMAQDLGVSHAIAEAIGKTFEHQVEQGQGAAYVPELIDLLRKA